MYAGLQLIIYGFNSRTHEGCDLPCGSLSPGRWSFNSRTHEGCDLQKEIKSIELEVFQFTHPRGVRRAYT